MPEILGVDELNSVINAIETKIRKEILIANNRGYLGDYLASLGCTDINVSTYHARDTRQKILIIGHSKVSHRHVDGIIKQAGVAVHNCEKVLEYGKVESFDFNKLRDNQNYSLILAGPMAHMQKGTRDRSSMISQMEAESDRFPPVIRITNESGDLCISKSSLKKAFEEARLRKYIL